MLSFEASSFVPAIGEVVPCRWHGYCEVSSLGGGRGRVHLGRRAQPRSRLELVEWLRVCRSTTVHALRRERFTLRMLADVEAEMGLDVDLITGHVSVRWDDRPPPRER